MALSLVAADGTVFHLKSGSGYTATEEASLDAYVATHRPRTKGDMVIVIASWHTNWRHLAADDVWRRWGGQKRQAGITTAAPALTAAEGLPVRTEGLSRGDRWRALVGQLDGIAVEHVNALWCRKCHVDLTDNEDWAFVLLDGAQVPCHIEECISA